MTVHIGDLYKDKDTRRGGRIVRVQFVEGDYATVVNTVSGVSSDVKLKRLEKKFEKAESVIAVDKPTLADQGYIQIPSSEELFDRTMEAILSGETGRVDNLSEIVDVVIDQLF